MHAQVCVFHFHFLSYNYSDILSNGPSGTYSGILFGIYSDFLAFYLDSFEAFILAFFLAFVQTFSLTFWHSVGASILTLVRVQCKLRSGARSRKSRDPHLAAGESLRVMQRLEWPIPSRSNCMTYKEIQSELNQLLTF